MERKIQWNSGCFDEIDLVYDKAAEKEVTSKILTDLEVGALAEAKAYLGYSKEEVKVFYPDLVQEGMSHMKGKYILVDPEKL